MLCVKRFIFQKNIKSCRGKYWKHLVLFGLISRGKNKVGKITAINNLQ